jgi:iron complex transport system ATP-binding protein
MNVLLKIENVSGGYHQKNVVNDVSLDINQGDFLGIIGPNGSGKTTLLRLATRVLIPVQGRIYFREENIFKIQLKEFCRNTAFVSQDVAANFSFTALEMALMGRIPYLKRLEFESRKDFEIAEKALSQTDSLGLKEKRIDEMSAGERQRVIIARALAQEPVLLFLDEPTAHLDIGHQIQIMDLLKKLNRDKKLTIVIILHDLNLAGEYCNRICLLDKGRIFKEGPPDDVLTYQNIEAVYNTIVVVSKNPINSKPYVLLVSKEK